MLSNAARAVWGKSMPQRAQLLDELEGWSPLWRHLEDSVAVAGRLWDTWLPDLIRHQLGDACGGQDGARTLLSFIAGIHDIGKATPAFSVQVGALRDAMVQENLTMPKGATSLPGRSTCPHAIAGQAITEQWLAQVFGWAPVQAASLASVIGGHHGVPPSTENLRPFRLPVGADDRSKLASELLGAARWQDVQYELLQHIADKTGAASWLRGPAWKSLPHPALALLLGLVVVCDWIASNTMLFPLTPITGGAPIAQPQDDTGERLEHAWRKLRLPSPWTADDVLATADELLSARFDFPAHSARAIQRAVVDAARDMDALGMLIIEAPMGDGKTEAGLMAAEVLAARAKAGGVFVALPTRATSDAMFSRIMKWIAHEPSTDRGESLVPDGDDAADRRSVFLAYGKSWLNSDFRAVPHSAPLSSDVDLDGDADQRLGAGGAYVDAWMVGRRKGVLADFVVGTIDQVLFAALQSRHVALRHLALARKVVILDEVHSFDAYMNVYLERAIEWLGAYGVPVIAMSATLPQALRNRLFEAYQRGNHYLDHAPAQTSSAWDRAKLTSSAVKLTEPSSVPVSPTSSVVTYTKDGETLSIPVASSTPSRSVRMEAGADDYVLAILQDALSDGGCALIVRNTVKRAQDTYQRVVDQFGPDNVRLLHSRFLASDRSRLEAELRKDLGKPGNNKRPDWRIVVATQVVEQSLDLDFDLLITDLAPTDLLLQRIGRLHRHDDRLPQQRPAKLRQARCVVVGVDDWASAPPVIYSGSVTIYHHHLLYRTAAQVLRVVQSNGVITLPDDIAPLVEEAYGDSQVGPEDWQQAMALARSQAAGISACKESAARSFRLPSPNASGRGLVGWLDGSVGDAETGATRAQVRDSGDGFSVLVVQTSPHGQWRLPDWLDSKRRGEALTMEAIPSGKMAEALAGTSVGLPDWVCEKYGDAIIGALEALMPPTWQKSPALTGELILPLDEKCQWHLEPLTVSYDPHLGLSVKEDK
ncbi:MAG: CRISPR-associated helicase Cas3' [Propionibacteriaceae bacterium]|nr:CRISPR-associated helicase Cas3' [Propionibacteriaceae bacterium]